MSFISKTSGLSILGRMAYAIAEPNYEDLSNEELKEYYAESININRILVLENEIFEQYLERNNPQALVAMEQILETAVALTSQIQRFSFSRVPSSLDSIAGLSWTKPELLTPMSPRSVGSRQSFAGSHMFSTVLSDHSSIKGFRITLSHRIEITNKEIDEKEKQLLTREKRIAIKRANLRAQSEEIDLRLRDIEEAQKELDLTVMQENVDSVACQIPAEKFLKYMDIWMKTVDRIIYKLRLKYLSGNSHMKKCKKRLFDREALGQYFHIIDFETLAIANKEYSTKICEKNRQLVDLRKITSRYNLELCDHKIKLHDLHSIIDDRKRKIVIKKKDIIEIKTNLENMRLKLYQIEQHIPELIQAIGECELPNVPHFIQIHMELQEMGKTCKRIERHRNIQIAALRVLRKRQQLLN